MAIATEAKATSERKTRNTVLVCSRLPISIVLNHPMDPAIKVNIRGLNAAQRGNNGHPIAVPFITTEVDEDFWSAWDAAHGLNSKKPFSSIKSGAIYVAKDAADANAIAREREKNRTGLEGMDRQLDSRMGLNKKDNVFPDRD